MKKKVALRGVALGLAVTMGSSATGYANNKNIVRVSEDNIDNDSDSNEDISEESSEDSKKEESDNDVTVEDNHDGTNEEESNTGETVEGTDKEGTDKEDTVEENGGVVSEDESITDDTTDGSRIDATVIESAGTSDYSLDSLMDASVPLSAREGTYNCFKYKEYADYIEITGAEYSWGTLGAIPEEINGKPVTHIADSAFSGNLEMSGNLILPSSIKRIGDNAFWGCSQLKGRLEIPEGVEYIGDSAFEGTGLTGNLSIPSSVHTIGTRAFSRTSFNGNLTLNYGLRTIGSQAFSGVGFTGNLTIPSTVTSLGGGVFEDCNGFNGRLTILGNLQSIGASVFKNCSGLTGELVIPASVTSIGDEAFAGCSGLTGELVIPDSVTSIGDSAFRGCRGFTGTLVIPESITSIEESTFESCISLSQLVIPDSVTSIGDSAFFHCNGLTGELSLPSRVTIIGSGAFSQCSGLTGDLIIPDSVVSIGDSAFYKCTGFTGNLILGDKVTSIGEVAFQESGFTGELVIPNSVESIDLGAFYGCAGFTGELVIPDTVVSLGLNAFGLCTGIERLDITNLNSAISMPYVYSQEQFNGTQISEVKLGSGISTDLLTKLKTAGLFSSSTAKVIVNSKEEEFASKEWVKTDSNIPSSAKVYYTGDVILSDPVTVTVSTSGGGYTLGIDLSEKSMHLKRVRVTPSGGGEINLDSGITDGKVSSTFNSPQVATSDDLNFDLSVAYETYSGTNWDLEEKTTVYKYLKPEIEVSDKIYDGTNTADVNVVFKDSAGSTVELLKGIDYDVTATFEDSNIGNDKVVNVEITLKDSGKTKDGNNYRLAMGSFTATGNIIKYDSTLEGQVTVNTPTVTYGDEVTITVTPQIARQLYIMDSSDEGTNKVQLIKDGRVLVECDATSVYSRDLGTFNLVYDTSNKGLDVGENTVTVRFTGTDSVNSSSINTTITVNKKETNATYSETYKYDGLTSKTVELNLDNLDDTDSSLDKTATLTLDPSTIDAGSTVTILGVDLQDETLKKYYNVNTDGIVLNVIKNDSVVEGNVEVNTPTVTYGEVATLTVTPQIARSTFSHSDEELDPDELNTNKVQLIKDGKVLVEKSLGEVYNRDLGSVTLEYDTSNKGLDIGTNNVKVRFTGNNNLNASEVELVSAITVNKKELTASGDISYKYDGKTEKEVTLTLIGLDDSDSSIGTSIEATLHLDPESINVGTATVTSVEVDDETINKYYNLVFDGTVTITKGNSTVESNEITNGSGVPTSNFTFADNLKVSVTPMILTYARSVPSINEVSLKIGDTVVGTKSATLNSATDFDIDLSETSLEAGSYEVKAIYGGNSNLEASSEVTLGSIEIAPIELSATVNSSVVYNGGTEFSGIDLTLVEKEGSSSVEGITGTATIAIDNKNVGSYSITNATSVQLVGDKANQYNLDIGQVTGTLNVTPLEVTSFTAVIDDKVYEEEGNANGTVTSVSFTPAIADELQLGVDYTADAVFSSTEIGDDIPVTVTIRLNDTEAARNYSISGGNLTAETTGNIIKRKLVIKDANILNSDNLEDTIFETTDTLKVEFVVMDETYTRAKDTVKLLIDGREFGSVDVTGFGEKLYIETTLDTLVNGIKEVSLQCNNDVATSIGNIKIVPKVTTPDGSKPTVVEGSDGREYLDIVKHGKVSVEGKDLIFVDGGKYYLDADVEGSRILEVANDGTSIISKDSSETLTLTDGLETNYYIAEDNPYILVHNGGTLNGLTISGVVDGEYTITLTDESVVKCKGEAAKVLVDASGSLVVVIPNGGTLEKDDDTTMIYPGGGTVDSDGVSIIPNKEGNVIVIKPDGSVLLPNGEIRPPVDSAITTPVIDEIGNVIIGVPDNTDITLGGTDIGITTGGNVVVTVDGETSIEIERDGSVVDTETGTSIGLPNGGIVSTDEVGNIVVEVGANGVIVVGDKVVNLPNGGTVTVNPNGNLDVELPIDGTITVGNNTVTLPDGGNVTVRPDGSIDMTVEANNGGIIVNNNKIELPNGGNVTVRPDGSVDVGLPTDGTITVGGNTVTLPNGGNVIVKPDGSIDITVGENSSEIIVNGNRIELPNGGNITVKPDGSIDITVGDNSSEIIINGNRVEVSTSGGTVTILPDGSLSGDIVKNESNISSSGNSSIGSGSGAGVGGTTNADVDGVDSDTNSEVITVIGGVDDNSSNVVPFAPADVNDTHYAYNSIKTLHEKNIMVGYNNYYRPNENITRAEFAVVLNKVIKSLGIEATSDSNIEYKDTDKNSWYADALDNISSLGVMVGYNDGNFKPNNSITREEAALAIDNLLSKCGIGASEINNVVEFKDMNKISHWAKDSVTSLSGQGIISGYRDNTFKPKNNITRAEVATMIVKTLNE